MTGLRIFPFQNAPKPLEPWILRQGQHTEHRNPLDPKKSCKGIGILLLSAVPLSSPNTWKTQAQVPFSSGKGQATSPSWSRGVAGTSLHPFFPNFGKATPPGRGKTGIRWLSKEEQARLAVLALREIHLGAPAAAPRIAGVWETKQALVLATGIQVSPLPGECPDPRAPESCSLLPFGAPGLDLMDFYFYFSLMRSFFPPHPPKKGGVPLSSSAGRIWRMGFPRSRECSLRFRLFFGKGLQEFCLLLLLFMGMCQMWSMGWKHPRARRWWCHQAGTQDTD